MPFFPRFPRPDQIDEITPDNVIVASEYEATNHANPALFTKQDNTEQDEKIQELIDDVRENHPEVEFLNDYYENIARQVSDKAVNDDKKRLSDAGKPFDMNYTEPKDGAILPCKVITNSHGVQVPLPAAPWEMDNPNLDIGMVYFDNDGNPLYEDNKHKLKVQTSQDIEYQHLQDDNAPEQAKEFNRVIMRVIDNWEKRHPVEKTQKPKVLDTNQYTLIEIGKHIGIEIKFDNKFNNKFWSKQITNPAVLSLLKYYMVSEIEQDKIQDLETILTTAVSQKLFDMSKIDKKCR